MPEDEKCITLTDEAADRIADKVLSRAISKADEAIGAGFRGWVFKLVLATLVFVLGIAASKGIKP